jgi:hypothetical protein
LRQPLPDLVRAERGIGISQPMRAAFAVAAPDADQPSARLL